MTPLTTLYDEYIDRPKLCEQKIGVYSSSLPTKVGVETIAITGKIYPIYVISLHPTPVGDPRGSDYTGFLSRAPVFVPVSSYFQDHILETHLRAKTTIWSKNDTTFFWVLGLTVNFDVLCVVEWFCLVSVEPLVGVGLP